jgi:hypothetical protein
MCAHDYLSDGVVFMEPTTAVMQRRGRDCEMHTYMHTYIHVNYVCTLLPYVAVMQRMGSHCEMHTCGGVL